MISLVVFSGACILAAFCSGSETAFSAAGRIQVAARGRKGARALWFMERPSRYLATTLVGTNVGVVLTSSITHRWGVQLGDVWQLVFAFATAVFLLLFSEITPKHLALFRSSRVSVASAPALFVFRIVMYPLIAAASGISRLIAGNDTGGRFFESREEVRGLLCSAGGRKGRLASSVLSVADTQIRVYSKRLDEFPGVDSGVGKKQAVELLLASGENLLLVWENAGATLSGSVKSSVLARWDGEGSITRISTGLPYFDGKSKPLKVLSAIWKSEAGAAILLDDNKQPESVVTAEMILTHLIPEQDDA